MISKADSYLVNDIRNILERGYKDINPRPHYADGTPAHTYSVNHVIRKYDLSKNEFPICTLRPIAWRNAIKEIFWIYVDQSNSLKLLRDKYGIKWWDEWESKDIPDTIGIRYGETVRRNKLVDKLLADISINPYGRRHIMSLWQEEDFNESDGLMPCCFETIWNVRGEYLDMVLIQRSGDMLTASGAGGVNEVQYAVLQMMVAKATRYKPGVFTHFVANEQIYDRHVDAAYTLMERMEILTDEEGIYEIPKTPFMIFNPSDNAGFYDFEVTNFTLVNYTPVKPQLKLELGI